MNLATRLIVFSTLVHLISYLIPSAIPEHILDVNWSTHARFHILQAAFWMVGLDLLTLMIALGPFRHGERWSSVALLIAGFCMQTGYYISIVSIPEGAPDVAGANWLLGIVMIIYFTGLVIGSKKIVDKEPADDYPALIFQESVIINATADRVYSVITQFEDYKNWNPWIVYAEGEVEEGKLVKVKSKLGPWTLAVQHKILDHQPPHTFRWCDVGWFTIMAYGQRARSIDDLGEGKVRYQVELKITGMGIIFVKLLFGKALEEGVKAETDALREYAEKN